jgi:hypothetical protein
MSTAVRLTLPAALITALAACGGAQPKPVISTTRTTSALVVQPQDETEKRALKERTEQQAALLDEERETRQLLVSRQLESADVRREQDDLSVRVAEAIENADIALDAVRDAAVKDGWRKWPKVDKATRTAQRHKAKLLMDLRRLHGDLGMMTWSVFKADVEKSIGDLESTTAEARAIY